MVTKRVKLVQTASHVNFIIYLFSNNDIVVRTEAVHRLSRLTRFLHFSSLAHAFVMNHLHAAEPRLTALARVATSGCTQNGQLP